MAVLPAGHLRTLSWATLANTVGSGLWLAGVALFLTRSVGLSPSSVGVGLTIAGLVGLSASVPLGHLADRRDPRTVRAVLQVMQAVVAASYLLVQSFATFLVVAVLDAVLVAGNLTVRAALVAVVAGTAERVRAFAALRAVANVGISVGAALAGLALAADTRAAYALLVAGNASTYLISAALIMRLPKFLPAPGPGRASAWAALRDGPFLVVGVCSALMSVHSVVLSLVLPLWIVAATDAPRPVVSAVLVTNTALTVLLAVRLSRGARTAVPAARALRRAGIVLAAAMVIFAITARLPTGPAVGVLLFATAVYTAGDLLHATAAAGLAYDLADPEALGQYQGASGLLTGAAAAATPALLTVLLLDGHLAGWLVLAAGFAAVGMAAPVLTNWALSTRKPHVDPLDVRQDPATSGK